MLAIALLFLVGVLLALRPLAQIKRERDVAEKLKNVHDPVEASVVMDGLINTTRHESDFIQKVLSRVWPFLFR